MDWMCWMKNNGGTGGLGILNVTTIVFVVLKLTGGIDWSWWWVLSPTIAVVGLSALFVALYSLNAFLNARGY